jgi:hypothetical protein
MMRNVNRRFLLSTGADYKTSTPLTTMVLDKVALYNKDFVATQLFPEVGVPRDLGKFWDSGIDMLRLENTERAPGELGQMSTREGSYTSYVTRQYAAASPITVEERDTYKEYVDADLEAERAEDNLGRLLLAREKRVVTLIATSGSFGTVRELVANELWNNHTGENHDIVKDVRTAVAAILPIQATHIIAPARVQLATLGSPSIMDFVKYASGPEWLARGLWGPQFMGLKVITSDATYLSNVKGAANVAANLYTDDVVVAALAQNVGTRKTMGWGVSFVYPSIQANLVVDTWGGYDNDPALTKYVRVRDKGRVEQVLHAACAYKIGSVLGE